MEFIFKINIIILIIHFSNSITPIWNFLNSTEDIFLSSNTYSYILFNSEWNGDKLKLIKKITKTSSMIYEKNYLKINNEIEKETNWDNIESFYSFDGIIYICPSGRNYLNKYYNGNFIPLKPNDEIINDWDLKCYYQSNGHWLFVFHLNLHHPGKIYGYKIKTGEFKNIESIKNGIFDFIWTYHPLNNNLYNMIGLLIDDLYITLHLIQIKIEENALNGIAGPVIHLDKSLKYLRSNFSKDNFLYWFSYDEDNFISGFSNQQIYYTTNIKDLTYNLNHNIPFEFINNSKIKYIHFIKQTKFIYYEIEENSNENKIIHHGIIDIKNNIILFNTNETIKDIKYHTSNSLLIITENSVYKLCIFAKNKINNKCIDECPSNTELILDTEKSNYCGKKVKNYCDNYILKPNDICVSFCDENIFLIENKICGLCRDLYSNKPYKIYNEKKCLENKPENTFYLYEKLKILKYCDKSCKTCFGEKNNECLTCKDGYNFENGKCILIKKCFETCLDCKEESTDIKIQKCISCKDSSKFLQEDKGNCIDKCSYGYYEENHYCKTYHSNYYSIIRIPKKPLLDEIILTKYGEIKYSVSNNINNEDKSNIFNYEYCFEGIKHLNLFISNSLDFKKYNDDKICFVNFLKDDPIRFTKDICELLYSTKYIEKKIYSIGKNKQNRFFGGTPQNLINHLNRFTLNKTNKIDQIIIEFNNESNYLINVNEDESLIEYVQNYNYMICLPLNVFYIFENVLFKNYNKNDYVDFFKLNIYQLKDEQNNLFPNISFKIGNKILKITKDFLYISINKKYHLFNEYRCNNFIFGNEFFNLFDFKEFNLENGEINLYFDKNINLIINDYKENKIVIIISKFNIMILFSFIIVFIIIYILKKYHKNKKIEYFKYYFEN